MECKTSRSRSSDGVSGDSVLFCFENDFPLVDCQGCFDKKEAKQWSNSIRRFYRIKIGSTNCNNYEFTEIILANV
jgi:hypothetical protein